MPYRISLPVNAHVHRQTSLSRYTVLSLHPPQPVRETQTQTETRDEGFPPQTLPISQRKDLNFLRQTVWYVAVSFAFFSSLANVLLLFNPGAVEIAGLL